MLIGSLGHFIYEFKFDGFTNFPTLGTLLDDGGVGFDYRININLEQDEQFGGQGRLKKIKYDVVEQIVHNDLVRPFCIHIDVPSQTGLVLQPLDNEEKFEEKKE
ncbi:hypothetical protein IMG5_068050 [Ichthyophthirius multifiliis]|uniref:Uncharacterized protein n=1 Tax=Ichthyophthirius multifiliis TaxID=5932 RepID=G0QPH7_ICHMU|nr:hypothetical protein IMG5_068050 [Ichthyophthirius multifiliis]EGR32876.1 hypothetical protein IMG5_068050 [Ichthyophthirius multifiliis]|eukprot:XP_004036862.1 hypothetical protein IMG5_068050 [Ichthyophthirius multifiliis]